MARPLRIEYPGAFYHVMNRGSNQCAIFLDKCDRTIFLNTIERTVQCWGIRVHAYSLMDNHYHLLIETPLGNLSRAMRHLDGLYTQWFNKIHQRDGSLMRGRFKSILIDKEAYFLELIRYIHLNGVRAKLYPDPQFDVNTSHPAYLRLRSVPPWLMCGTALSYFSGDPRGASLAFHEFVKQGVSEDLQKILDGKRWPALLGTKKFVDRVRNTYIKPESPEPEIPQEKPLRKLASPRKVLRAVMKEFCVPFRAMLGRYAKPEIQSRNAAIYALRAASHLTYTQIGRYMGGLQKSQIARICQKGEENLPDRWRMILTSLEGKRET